ncbi:BsuPI-related putative proteinase inhibitor [Evansella tamaricis]|uniref:Intracellular proteinase inhibitor BsuPI domain-containing protein n=1 Tax=Evansella tamaricis TaxID=2069301 RepID=A0ABS6JCS4_9BACI|nr:BsuPI-related putative proteinase inhibitor [Evansella tamaricis]MBU9711469.1 hypothetical protein [Evansella tamaricis]
MKKFFIRSSCLFLLILLIVACGTSEESTGDGNSIGPIGGGESISVNGFVFDVEVEPNELFKVKMSLINETEETRQVEFSSGQKYDVFVKGAGDEVIYHYAEDKMFTQALVMETVGPGETLYFEDVWEQAELTSGEVSVEASLLIYGIDGEEIDREEFIQTITVVLE